MPGLGTCIVGYECLLFYGIMGRLLVILSDYEIICINK